MPEGTLKRSAYVLAVLILALAIYGKPSAPHASAWLLSSRQKDFAALKVETRSFAFLRHPVAFDIDGDGTCEITGGNLNSFYCLRSQKEALRWCYKTFGEITSAPIFEKIDNDRIYDIIFSSTDGNLYAVSGDSGALIWKFRSDGRLFASPMLFEGNIIAVSDKGTVYSLETGSALKWKYETGERTLLSPCMAGLLFPKVIALSNSGTVTAIDFFTGSLKWKKKLDGRFFAEPVSIVSDKRHSENIYVISEKGTLTRLNGDGAETGREELGARVLVSPAIAPLSKGGPAGLFVVSAEKKHFLIEEQGLKVLWRKAPGGIIRKFELLSDPVSLDLDSDGRQDFICGSEGPVLYAVSGKTGDVIGRVKASDSFCATPCIADMDGDGFMEILSSAGDNRIYTMKTKATTKGQCFKYRMDHNNTGEYRDADK